MKIRVCQDSIKS